MRKLTLCLLSVMMTSLMTCCGDSSAPPTLGPDGNFPIPSAPPPRPVPPGINGADVSHYEHPIDWSKLGPNITFVFIKATEGVTIQDDDFAVNWAGAKHQAVLRGAFCLFHPNDDPIEEAKYFLKTMGKLEPGDLPPVLDLEMMDKMPAKKVVANALIWLRYVKKATGVTPIIYVGPIFMSRLGHPLEFAKYPLWQAEWSVTRPSYNPPWTNWTFWQYTDSGRQPGVPIEFDQNVFNGTFEELQRLLVK